MKTIKQGGHRLFENDPETKATAIRVGNPASWHLAEMAAKESEGRFAAVSDEQILAAQADLARRDGVFVEPASAAGIAGLLSELAAGDSYAGKTVVVTVTGHGVPTAGQVLGDGVRLAKGDDEVVGLVATEFVRARQCTLVAGARRRADAR